MAPRRSSAADEERGIARNVSGIVRGEHGTGGSGDIGIGRRHSERQSLLSTPPPISRYQLPPTPEWFGKPVTGAGSDRTKSARTGTLSLPQSDPYGDKRPSLAHVDGTTQGTRTEHGGLDERTGPRQKGRRGRSTGKPPSSVLAGAGDGFSTGYDVEANAGVSGEFGGTTSSSAPMPSSATSRSGPAARSSTGAREGEIVWRVDPFVFYVPRR